MKYILGATGVVGSSLMEQTAFEGGFCSRNLKDILSLPDDCEIYLSCLPAQKWLVNQNLERDLENINQILNVLKQKRFSKVVLISTIDVYSETLNFADESINPGFTKLSYGHNRRLFELLVKEFVKTKDLKIFRLPAIFNKNIKKNVVYDLINNNNLEKIVNNSFFQWYNLDNLYDDIVRYSRKYPNEVIFNLFPEPLHTSQIVSLFPNAQDKIDYTTQGSQYNYCTKFTNDSYHYSAKQSLEEIKKLINETRHY